MTKKIPVRAAIAGGMLWLCGCAGSKESQPPNFIVEGVQTGTRPTVSAAPTVPPEAGGNVPGENAGDGAQYMEKSGPEKAETKEPAGEKRDDGEERPDDAVQGAAVEPADENGNTGAGNAPESAPPGQRPDAMGEGETVGQTDASGTEGSSAPSAPGEGKSAGQTDAIGTEGSFAPAVPSVPASGEGEGESAGQTDAAGTEAGSSGGETEGGADIVRIKTAAEARQLDAGTAVDLEAVAEEDLPSFFSFEELPDEVFDRMKGKSYGERCTVPRGELRYVRVLHYGFDGLAHTGELVVNRAIAQDITDIFRELFDARYPIEKMLLIDEYDADDNRSMADNNTSSFNYRFVEGTSTVSLHAYGLAVDINPLYNPYLPMRGGVAEVLPENAEAYADRTLDCAYYIRPGDACCLAFARRGFAWGGDWENSKDYQHFSKRAE